MSVKTINLGTSLLFSGEDPREVNAVLQDHLSRGAETITPLSDVGQSWVASCTVPGKARAPDEPVVADAPDLVVAPRPASAPSRPGEGVKIIDAGESIMLRGDSEEEVRVVLQRFLRRGSVEIGQVGRVGRTEVWVASCTLPVKEESADKTHTFRLTDLAPGGADPGPDSESLRESKGQCRIEKFGFKRVITGATKAHVEFVVNELLELGGELVGDIAEDGGQWSAICDTAGIKNTGFRW